MGKSMLNGVCYGSDDANDIVYDNTTSGLTATNTKSAIDELATSVSELNSKLGGEEMNELFYGSLEEREALANAITNKGVDTNVSDTLVTMAENIGKIFTESTATLLHQISTTSSGSYTYTFSQDCDLCVAMISGSHNNNTSTSGLSVKSSTSKELIRFEKNPSSSPLSNPVKLIVLSKIKKNDKISLSWNLYGAGAIIKLN